MQVDRFGYVPSSGRQPQIVRSNSGIAEGAKQSLADIDSPRCIVDTPEELATLALSSPRRVLSNLANRTVIDYLPNPRAFRVLNTGTGSTLLVGHEILRKRRSQAGEGLTTEVALARDLDRLLGDMNTYTPLDGVRSTARRIHQLADDICESVGKPLVTKEVPIGHDKALLPVTRLDLQFLRMRMLQRLSETHLPTEIRDLIEFPEVQLGYFRLLRKGAKQTAEQWMVMDEICDATPLPARSFYALDEPILAQVVSKSENDIVSWSKLARWFASIGLPVADLEGRNVLKQKVPDGNPKYTIIDQ